MRSLLVAALIGASFVSPASAGPSTTYAFIHLGFDHQAAIELRITAADLNDDRRIRFSDGEVTSFNALFFNDPQVPQFLMEIDQLEALSLELDGGSFGDGQNPAEGLIWKGVVPDVALFDGRTVTYALGALANLRCTGTTTCGILSDGGDFISLTQDGLVQYDDLDVPAPSMAVLFGAAGLVVLRRRRAGGRGHR